MSTRRIAIVALLGFSSGLPLHLTGQTLTAWMVDEGVTLKTIGFFSMVALPYTFKFAWAPLLDRYRLPFLGRRRGWLLALHLALIAAIVTMGSIDARAAPATLAAFAVAVAFLSASLDVVVGGFSTDSLAPEERAAGSTFYVAGYKLAMLTSGAFALALAGEASWQAIYATIAGLLVVGVIATLLAEEPPGERDAPPTLLAAVWRPFALLLGQPGIAVVLAFVALFRLCDFFATVMVIPFLKQGVGFSWKEISLLYYVLGFVGTFAGGLLGPAWIRRIGLRHALVVFGAFQAVTNLGWYGLASVDRSVELLAGVVLVDNLAGSLAGGAFVAYLMSRCDPSVSATQYALLTSLTSLGARVFAAEAADLVDAAGWDAFWLATAALIIPALALVPLLPPDRATTSGR